MLKLLVFTILALIVLPIAYWQLSGRGGMKQFLLIAGGALLALTGIILQAFYSAYLVLLLIVCLAFLSSYVVVKYTGVPPEEPAPVTAGPEPAMPQKMKPDLGVIPELKSANQQPPSGGMASIEPIGRGQEDE
ncbi:hypothetical protein [Indiicoccus explosivorum]|uniref:hypothetical protein n=1 Tax=Indiicoccus explosivorum TaxID=1917864 RepID=UPI000B42D076|nr:hypothetical protein [Indiicoccus explosivorum]